MAGISRRTVLISAGAGVGAVALAGGGILAGQQIFSSLLPSPVQTGAPGIQPAVLRSSGGALTVNLVAEHTHSPIAGRTAHLMTYNGTTPGPTLVAKPGDTITVNFTNKLGEPTNLHTHGLHVSPAGNSDNVFIEVQSGETVQYTYKLGSDHPTGVYWYHPHHHGMAADQVFGGLYGALIVEEPSPIPVNTERVLVISDITLDAHGTVAVMTDMNKLMGREGAAMLLNGQVSPVFEAAAGATERWRIVNSCTSRYLNLSIPGASAQILGMDSGQFSPPAPLSSITLAPGNRADLLVNIGSSPATLAYTTVPHRDMMGMGATTTTYTGYPLATFTPLGSATPIAMGAIARDPGPNLRNVTVSAKRTFTLAMPAGMGGMGGLNGQFTINGKPFDMNTVNTTVSLGTVEEWTIRNTTTMDHPFHLHVWPMQVLTSGMTSFEGVQYRDVVNVPANSQAVVRVNFDQFPGQAVYHCHILDHEDLGMMGIIEAK
ncbi:MAG: hypothetical protein RIR88_550 [Actinomycetota bacterium]